ncbi:hypothetical protein A2766_02835 [Candidatus Kaiserbacteria bacterium RIFCSPHIGHO2_01_FULL_58_22]|uniref:Uncharacterized protein n=1 Tax=Candidatus Kaiserbacteria bacterium GW2011_GWA2_58_9 TaxID=1618672 RepID=A0A0G2BKL3_9BACT|nr:MAG: hypothetical protein UY98_C0029G0006 [Candidatus Kaiserbacteria bacterium GW2011_GWA2_58_9]OGG62760.1 MAG: hypothetical protein A2766_02835 [Candidatus Kaiserbacteria bacterium RIFCSPHIGHO2_01_FULL_58_22]
MEKPRIENLSAHIPIDMYQVSGHGEIDPEKYLRNKWQDNQIKLCAEKDSTLNKILDAPKQERASLIKQALSQEDPEVQRKAAEMILCAPEQEQASLQLLVLEKIKQALSQEDPEVQRKAAGMIRYVPEQERASLQLLVLEKIKQALSQEDPEVQRKAAEMILCAPKQERASLIKIAFYAGLGNEIVKSPLYDNSNFDKERFKRKMFEKTGSETTLVGGTLKDKLIIRHVKPSAFLAWQKIYENHQVWKNNGFDYVPIEPIQSYRLNKKGLVDVFSGVLDLSLAQWAEVSGYMFMEELGKQKHNIISVLERQGIRHGHTHDRNFVLRFFRNKDGNSDLNQVPRLYAIDFDAAFSPS